MLIESSKIGFQEALVTSLKQFFPQLYLLHSHYNTEIMVKEVDVAQVY